ncbi:MAG: hypothetical protein IT424_05430 [Pirellulales bacterium]|nr:hypothetical protein [Pirellulales bacterium]
MSTPQGGRPRSLTSKKQTRLCRLVAQGASVAEAARQVRVSLRTVERELRRDEDFEHDLQLAKEAAPVDPLKLMHAAARAHWRAAAWLLERTDPEHYARRPPQSCTAAQFKSATAALIEAALEAAPADHRQAVYLKTQQIADEALQRLFPEHARTPFAPPAGLKRNILTSEQQAAAFLDAVASNYQNPPPSTVAAASARPPEPINRGIHPPDDGSPDTAAPPIPAPRILSPELREAPLHVPDLHPLHTFDGDPAKQGYLRARLADSLRRRLAEAANDRAAAQPAAAIPAGVLSPKIAPSA